MTEREEMCCESTEVHEELLRIVNETLTDETELYDLAELFKVFGDSTRIRILYVLFEAEVCVCDMRAEGICTLPVPLPKAEGVQPSGHRRNRR